VPIRASGLPTLAFAASVVGFSTTALPLSLVLAQGQPGCTLWVTPDFLDFALVTDGTWSWTLAIPDSSALVGVQAHHQVVPIEIDALLQFTAITATDAITLQLGWM
jgi:hypothetical protein